MQDNLQEKNTNSHANVQSKTASYLHKMRLTSPI